MSNRTTQPCTCKEKLISATKLTNYDVNLLIHLAGDFSLYSVGAVISHTMPDGYEHPIAWASHTLSSNKKLSVV